MECIPNRGLKHEKKRLLKVKQNGGMELNPMPPFCFYSTYRRLTSLSLSVQIAELYGGNGI